MMKAFKPYELCPLDLKPAANIPDEWPWQVVDIEESDADYYLQNGFTVLSLVDYENYLASHQDNYDSWFIEYDANLKTTLAFQKFSIRERREWAEALMEELKLINIENNVNLSQSMWLHHRLRNLTFTVNSNHVNEFPPLSPLAGKTITIDFLNLVISGDVETAYAALVCTQPDDFSENYHVITADFINLIKSRIAEFVGWA